MFKYQDRIIPVDSPFVIEGVQYPQNWLRLTTWEEKQAIGLTEEPDPIPEPVVPVEPAPPPTTEEKLAALGFTVGDLKTVLEIE